MYEKTPILRGYTEISAIHELAAANNAFIAGGWVRWMVSRSDEPAPASDVDVFPADGNSLRLLEVFEKKGFHVTYESENAYSLMYAPGYSLDMAAQNPLFKYAPNPQIIKGKFVNVESMEATLDEFDMTIIAAGLLSPTEALVHECFHRHDAEGRIVPLKIGDPVRFVLRAMKYYKRGYQINPFDLATILTERQPDVDYWYANRDRYFEGGEF